MLYPSPCAVALPQSLASIKVAGEKKTSVVQVSTGVEELCGCGGQANATSGGSKAGGTASGARLGECNYKTAWRLALDNIGPNEFTTTVKKVSRQEREAWCGGSCLFSPVRGGGGTPRHPGCSSCLGWTILNHQA